MNSLERSITGREVPGVEQHFTKLEDAPMQKSARYSSALRWSVLVVLAGALVWPTVGLAQSASSKKPFIDAQSLEAKGDKAASYLATARINVTSLRLSGHIESLIALDAEKLASACPAPEAALRNLPQHGEVQFLHRVDQVIAASGLQRNQIESKRAVPYRVDRSENGSVTHAVEYIDAGIEVGTKVKAHADADGRVQYHASFDVELEDALDNPRGPGELPVTVELRQSFVGTVQVDAPIVLLNIIGNDEDSALAYITIVELCPVNAP